MTDPERIARLRRKANELPLQSGVYLMHDRMGEIIYIGKAKHLKNRVTSYFRALESHTPKVLAMVENVEDFSYILTSSEFEALLLECSLIKQHKPKYNILLKDDKGYSYICISQGPWRRLSAVYDKREAAEGYIGPYLSNFVVSQTVEQANKIFMLPTCSRRFPEDFKKGRPCLNYHIKQCMGVCSGKISLEAYNEAFEGALRFIRGGTSEVCESLEQQMNEAAGRLDFETAARLRDRLQAIRRVGQQQNVIYAGVDNCDIIAVAIGSDRYGASVMLYRGERLCDKKDFLLSTDSAPEMVRAEFLMRYYAECSDLPKKIYLDGECEDSGLITRFLSEKAGRKVELIVPQRGQKNQLVELCRENAAQYLSHRMRAGGKEVALLDELSKLLGLSRSPQYIEAFDISNIGADTIVGGMVVFEGAAPRRGAYRKFSIKSVSGAPDDYASMHEMLSRRLQRFLDAQAAGEAESEKSSSGDQKNAPQAEGFARLPDLWLIDGGQNHVAVGKQVLEEFGIDIPVFGMVKDERHRTRAVAFDGGEIVINANRSVFSFITRIQDEVHRYTISFSRKKHQKGALQLELCRAQGVGPARAKALFAHFKTMAAIRRASEEELGAAPGMTAGAAKSLYAFLHEEGNA